MRNKLFYVYILTNNSNKVLYTGITSNLKLRTYQHKNNNGSKFTSKYKIDKLVYYEVFEDPIRAIQREKTIKNLLRRKKIRLVNKFNPHWVDFYNRL